ncbi:hypothetical protein B9Z19DRAFT_49121 [Tuber borchii]|uniref:Uncharacterized protein n=1 Tax=Tuber borchii TaxID=42251 RepID=A0A2T7A6Z8_TUBBO|nr:hypothetical protein B9Z19DRAFT_49121 [Tuber borchii]
MMRCLLVTNSLTFQVELWYLKGLWDPLGRQAASAANRLLSFSLFCCSFLIIVEIVLSRNLYRQPHPLRHPSIPLLHTGTCGALAHGLWRGCCAAGLLKNRALSGSSDKVAVLCLQAVIPVAPSVQGRVRTTKDETVSSLDGRTSLAPSWTGWTDGPSAADTQNWSMRQILPTPK